MPAAPAPHVRFGNQCPIVNTEEGDTSWITPMRSVAWPRGVGNKIPMSSRTVRDAVGDRVDQQRLEEPPGAGTTCAYAVGERLSCDLAQAGWLERAALQKPRISRLRRGSSSSSSGRTAGLPGPGVAGSRLPRRKSSSRNPDGLAGRAGSIPRSRSWGENRSCSASASMLRRGRRSERPRSAVGRDRPGVWAWPAAGGSPRVVMSFSEIKAATGQHPPRSRPGPRRGGAWPAWDGPGDRASACPGP